MTKVYNDLPMPSYRRDKDLCNMLVHKKTVKQVCSSKSRCECKVCQGLNEGEVCDVTGKQMYKPVEQPACSLLWFMPYSVGNVRR